MSALAAQAPQPEPRRNTKTHDHLSTMIGIVLRSQEQHGLYAEGSVMDKAVKEAVAHLKDWPYPEAQAPQQVCRFPSVSAEMVYTFHRTTTDAAIGEEDFHLIQSGLASVFGSLNEVPQQAQGVSADVTECLRVLRHIKETVINGIDAGPGWSILERHIRALAAAPQAAPAPAPQAMTGAEREQHWPHGQGWGAQAWHQQGIEDAERRG